MTQQTIGIPLPPAPLPVAGSQPNAAMALAEGGVASQVEGIILLTENLTTLLTDELALIKRRDGKAIAALLPEKQILVRNYQKAIKVLMGERENLAELPAQLRESLRAAGRKLDSAAALNGQSLSLAAVATQKVLQVIVDAVRKEMQTHQTYHNPKLARRGWNKHAPASIPININQTA